MNMEFEIISSQLIKPSYPTTHPKFHKLSILDQFVPPVYIPMIFFYSADESTHAISDITHQRMKQLKESLSRVLTVFYPFAGRVKDKVTIDCNDEGVHYTEAKVSCSLAEFFNQPNLLPLLYKFIPDQAITEVSIEGYTTMAKVTCFACGGMVIGTSISHMIVDAIGVSFFLNSWGLNSRMGEFQRGFEFPNFDAPFPQSYAPQDTNAMSFMDKFLNEGRLALRRFLFDEKAISKLKTQGSSLTVKNPSRVEVVASLLCKCTAKAFKANSALERPTLITLAVNLRRVASPNFSNSFMGNFSWMATALMSANDELPELVTKFREASNSINSDLVKNFQGEGGFDKYCEASKHVLEKASKGIMMSTSGVNYLNYTSVCNLGFYGADFGWGKPIWVSCVTECDDYVMISDTPSGKGIEAWVYLNEDKMAILQQDNELLTFAIMDPNPLHLKDYKSYVGITFQSDSTDIHSTVSRL